MKNLIKEAYSYARAKNNTALASDIDNLVKKDKLFVLENYNSGSFRPELCKILEKHGVLNDNGEIIPIRKIVENAEDVKTYLRKCGKKSRSLFESASKIIDSYCHPFADKSIIFSKDFDKINEALTYMEYYNRKRVSRPVNESIQEVPLEVDDYVIDNFDDFEMIFDERFMNSHKAEIEALADCFDEGAEIMIKVFENPQTLTGYDCEIKWVGMSDEKIISSVNDVIRTYITDETSYATNESLDDLSGIDLREGSFEYTNLDDFLSMFDEEWLAKNKDKFADDLGLWFNNGGVLTINIFNDSNSVTGFDCSLGWRNGNSMIPNHSTINSLVRKYVTREIADSVNEDDEDFDMQDYNLGTGSNRTGEYQIIESSLSEFQPFDIVTVVSTDLEKTVIKFENGDTSEYETKELDGTMAFYYKDYDSIMECLDYDLSLPDVGITEEEIKNLIQNYDIEYDSVVSVLNVMKEKDQFIPCADGSIIFWRDNQFIRQTVDEFGDTEEKQICERCAIYYIILMLVDEKEKANIVPNIKSGIEGKYNYKKTYDAIVASGELEGDLLSDFISEWNEFVLPYADASDVNIDANVAGICEKYGVQDYIIMKDGVTSVVNAEPEVEFDKESIVMFLTDKFKGIDPEEIEFKITDEDVVRFNKEYKEFYSREENQEGDEEVAERYIEFLLDFMKSCGINIGLYRPY